MKNLINIIVGAVGVLTLSACALAGMFINENKYTREYYMTESCRFDDMQKLGWVCTKTEKESQTSPVLPAVEEPPLEDMKL